MLPQPQKCDKECGFELVNLGSGVVLQVSRAGALTLPEAALPAWEELTGAPPHPERGPGPTLSPLLLPKVRTLKHQEDVPVNAAAFPPSPSGVPGHIVTIFKFKGDRTTRFLYSCGPREDTAGGKEHTGAGLAAGRAGRAVGWSRGTGVPPTWGRPPWRACRVPGATPPHADWLRAHPRHSPLPRAGRAARGG